MTVYKAISTLLVATLFTFHVFSQSKVVLEPVGRYLYQSSQKDFVGTDHLLNAIGLSDNKILVVSNSALTIVDREAMSVSGDTNYLFRSDGGGGRDAVVYNDTYVYVNKHQSESRVTTYGFGISKITDSGITTLTGIDETDVFFEKMKIYNDRLYVAAHSDGIRIYSLLTPESPSLIASLTDGFTDAFDMAVSGDTLYVADGAGGLKIVDISEITSPKLLGGETTTTAMGTAQDVEVKNGKIYLASGGAGICVYENGNLSSRKIYELTGCAEDLCWVGDYLAVSTFGGVSVLEVGEGTNLAVAGSENTSRFSTKAYIRNAFGVGAANDSTLLVSSWTTTDCYQIKSTDDSEIADINCSTQRIRFPAAGGSETHFVTNNGGATLTISSVSSLSGDYSCDFGPQSIEPGDTVYFEITYTAGDESEGEILYLYSNDPDENPLPIKVYGNTSSLDAGEEVPDFTLPTIYTDPSSGTYSEETFTLSEQKGKVVWIQIFGTWCPACPSAEVDMQNTIVKEFANTSQVATYVLNENQQDRDPLDWVNFWTTKYYQRAPMLYDADGTVGSETFSQPSVGNMPFGRGFIIDQDGLVAKAFFGHQPQMVIETIYDLLKDVETGISISENTNEPTIYPNPVVDKLTIGFDEYYGQTNITVFNTFGQVVKSVELKKSNSASIQMSNLPSGIYFVHISFDGNTITKQIVKI
jgi:thiol-disulfide isomerase/thioredoxin